MTAYSILSILSLLINLLVPVQAQVQSNLQSIVQSAKPSADMEAKLQTPTGINQIGHVIVIYMENHSFDNLYGGFPGADGLSDALPANYIQIDTATGMPFKTLPWSKKFIRLSQGLPNKFFNIDQFVPSNQATIDLTHRYYQEIQQIDGGKMDKFAAISSAKGLTMGYYYTNKLPVEKEAANYTLCDHFFHSAFGGSWLNHIWLIAAATPQWAKAPLTMRAVIKNGKLITDGALTPDGDVVNTIYSVNSPHPKDEPKSHLMPSIALPTIGDRLTDAKIDWAWYSGGWNDAMAGHPDPLFECNHQPFVYFDKYADGKPAKYSHLEDEQDFISAAKAGTLPPVSFVKPIGEFDEHPNYTNVMTSEKHLEELINDIRNGPNWKDCVIIVTYDEHGGFWDHVSPPKIDQWGPGIRVPAIIISPFAKKGFIDHTQYETVSILSFIEKRWGLSPLSSRDSLANPLTNAFNF